MDDWLLMSVDRKLFVAAELESKRHEGLAGGNPAFPI
jgi:hypothetical protein